MQKQAVYILKSKALVGEKIGEDIYKINTLPYEDIIKKNAWQRNSRVAQLLLVCFDLLDSRHFAPESDFSIFLGTQFSSCNNVHEFDMCAQLMGPLSVNPSMFPNTVLNAPSCVLGIELKCPEEIYSLCTGICAGIDAVGLAYKFIKAGKRKRILSGAYDEVGEIQNMVHTAKCNIEAVVLHELGLVYEADLKNSHKLEICAYVSRNVSVGLGYDQKKIKECFNAALSEAEIRPGPKDCFVVQTTIPEEAEKCLFIKLWDDLCYKSKIELLDIHHYGASGNVILNNIFEQCERNNEIGRAHV